MSQALLALQESIYSVLFADSTLAALVPAIHQHVPESTDFPYLVIDPETSIDRSVQGSAIEELGISVRIFMREKGSKKPLEASQKVYELLHEASLTLDGYTLIDLRVTEQSITIQNDGLTYQALLRLKAVVEEA